MNVLLRVDIAIIAASFGTFMRNWKDILTVLLLIAFAVGVAADYAASISGTVLFYAPIAFGGASGYGSSAIASARIRYHARGSPFALDGLDPYQSKTYFAIWTGCCLVLTVFVAWFLYTSALTFAVLAWGIGVVAAILVDHYARAAQALGDGQSTARSGRWRRYLAYVITLATVTAIIAYSVIPDSIDQLDMIVIGSSALIFILLTPVSTDSVPFFRAMGIGYLKQCIDIAFPAILPSLVLIATVAWFVDNVPLVLSLIACSFAILGYRILQIGLLRFLSPRVADLALGLGTLALILFGFTFPPLAGLFLIVVIVWVAYRASRVTWLIS